MTAGEIHVGDRVVILDRPWLSDLAGRTGTVEQVAAGVQGRHRVRLDEPWGFMAHVDVRADEIECRHG